MKLRLVRLHDTGEATVGVLQFCGSFFCFTLEDTALATGPGIYRIPEGSYPLRRCLSPKFGETFTVENVAGHSLLRVHWGNTSGDTEGCILVGSAVDMQTEARIWHSKATFTMFMDAMVGVMEAQLTIENHF
jgi:hypothetical protein